MGIECRARPNLDPESVIRAHSHPKAEMWRFVVACFGSQICCVRQGGV